MKCCLLRRPLLHAYCSFSRISVLRDFPSYSATSLLLQKTQCSTSRQLPKTLPPTRAHPNLRAHHASLPKSPNPALKYKACTHNSCIQIFTDPASHASSQPPHQLLSQNHGSRTAQSSSGYLLTRCPRSCVIGSLSPPRLSDQAVCRRFHAPASGL